MVKFAPLSFDGEDMERSALAALVNFIGVDGLSGEYYFAINGHDPPEDIFYEIKDKYPKAIIHKFSESEGYEFCFGMHIDNGREMKCAPYPLMDARFIAMPLWHVALVSAGITGCGCQFWVLNALGRWTVLTGHVGCV
ncbi:hypothetical protein [Nitrospirillum viridazoti]|uniref:hypothetical protein n=1 Tax=Nitrospirillum viridazoti TaxID=3144925 RepID=UPI00110FF275|nr:hypothetical protein [Nitrospirillum amazonense]